VSFFLSFLLSFFIFWVTELSSPHNSQTSRSTEAVRNIQYNGGQSGSEAVPAIGRPGSGQSASTATRRTAAQQQKAASSGSSDPFGPPASGNDASFGDFASFGAPAQGNSGFGDFGAPAQGNSGFGDFGAPAQGNSGFGAPAQGNSGFGSFGAPAPASSGFGGGFGSFSAPAPAPVQTQNFGFATDFGGPAKSPSRPQASQSMDPFGDIPSDMPSLAPERNDMLLPDNKGKPAPAEFSGLVDLDNLRKYDSGKKDSKGPGASLNSMGKSAPPPTANVRGFGGAPAGGFGGAPMGGFGGAPAGGFGAPAGGFGGAPSGGFGAPQTAYGAPRPQGGFGAPQGGFGASGGFYK